MLESRPCPCPMVRFDGLTGGCHYDQELMSHDRQNLITSLIGIDAIFVHKEERYGYGNSKAF